MLKVLVVDDEKLVRQMVIRCIDWEKLGMSIEGEASSARLAIEKCDEECPDLIVMDIRMPGINGLNCARQILEKHPKVRIIILSGHDEFEYASEGIQIGVFRYLLKPINESELREAVENARDAILEERSREQQFETYRQELEKHADYIVGRQICSMVRSDTPSLYLDSLAYFGKEIRGRIFQVMLVEQYSEEEVSEEKRIINQLQIRKLAEDYYTDYPGVIAADNGVSRVMLVNNAKPRLFYDTCEEFQDYLENNLPVRTGIGIGNEYSVIEGLKRSYQEAKDALRYRFAFGNQSVISYRDIGTRENETESVVDVEGSIHEIGNAVRIGDDRDAVNVLSGILTKARSSGISCRNMQVLAMQLLTEIIRVLTENRTEEREKFLQQYAPTGELFALDSFDRIQEYMLRLIGDACSLTRAELSGREKTLVEKVREYIARHYGEEISQASIASEFYVNSSYLSRVFREKTGETFTAYLLETRMTEAEKLLLNTDLKAYEIAEKVGIQDPHYFSVCFKKHTGMSVMEYRRRRSTPDRREDAG